MKQPDYLFEVSWEVCNKVGGIHTVVSTKAKTLNKLFGNNFIMIGPDICRDDMAVQEFEPDEYAMTSWAEYARNKGLKLRIGRWKTLEEQPPVVLVDFTPYFNQKDEILTELWNEYSLDSLTGGWDYIEPCLFGYAAAKVIESYYEFYLEAGDTIVAQFHEWMTGSGILYLKKQCPQIATAFTTHATVLGRCLSGNGMPLYSALESYNADSLAMQFGVRAKQSLEKLSAQNADVFTTVSEITNRECSRFLGKSADVITPNGFENDMVPKDEKQKEIRLRVRRKLTDITERLYGEKISDDALFVINSGRYEFFNKGTDLFIEAMGELNKQQPEKEILAVVAVPTHHLKAFAENENSSEDSFSSNAERISQNGERKKRNAVSTHRLFDEDNDLILRKLSECGLNNSSDCRVKVLFIPSYLDGADGVINETYFDFLQAFDLGIFPSYYEPWGYTPMESIAFGVPTLTTSLAGFGLWIRESVSKEQRAVTVMERTDDNAKDCVSEIVSFVKKELMLSPEERELIRQECKQLSGSLVWASLANNYLHAYEQAMDKARQRFDMYGEKQALVNYAADSQTQSFKEAHWRKILFRQKLPERLYALEKLSRNLWWSWNKEAYNLFERINPEKFAALENNPLPLLESLTADEIERLVKDEAFLAEMDKVEKRFDEYMYRKPEEKEDMVAYFSMEYGIDNCLKIYSGGLGILAGDYLKEASDSCKNIIGIGLLYRYGYFTQHITKDGEQLCEYNAQKFTHLPLKAERDSKGEWRKISLSLPGRTLEAKIWRIDIGRVPLYLLDTDIESNREEDRSITSRLYGGNSENRLKQEIVLGMGGVRLIEQLQLPVKLYHNNEGHAAFSSLERMKSYVRKCNLTYLQAKELVRASTLFTTHTPVAAGHDMFEENLLRAYLGHFADYLGISWEEFMNAGRMKGEKDEKFSMSVLAMNFSAQVNAVSLIHRDVSRKMFAPLYEGFFPEESHIDYVTNGVHHLTWTSPLWQDFYRKTFGEEYLSDTSNAKYWKKIFDVPDEELWTLHKQEKEALMAFIRRRLEKEYTLRAEDPQVYFKTIKKLSGDKLTVGFARRFATYKRANLLFTNLERLQEIVDKGVQFIFAGKAHPQDKAGADLIRRIMEVSRMPQFTGSIIFIENYDMSVAKQLVKGVDVWLNMPTRPLEASGTSGEKAVMNGVVNFSVLDGWWAEGYRPEAGWALPKEATYTSDDYQNALDAQMLYDTFLSEIIPAYNERNEKGISEKWCGKMKHTIADIAPHYTMRRQIDDYYNKFYRKMAERTRLLEANASALAREYSQWKHNVMRLWDSVRPIGLKYPDSEREAMDTSGEFYAEVSLYLSELKAEEIGVELVIANKQNEKINTYTNILPFELVESGCKKATYRIRIQTPAAGVHDYAIRVYPHCDLMPHRMDFPVVKWV